MSQAADVPAGKATGLAPVLELAGVVKQYPADPPVTALADIDLRTTVSGEVMQDANTRDLIVDVPGMIEMASSVMTLYPGDIIASGTPAGIGPIFDGDVIDVIIERVGHLHVSVSEEGAVACPTLGTGAGPTPPPPPAR